VLTQRWRMLRFREIEVTLISISNMAPLNSGQTLNPRYPMWSLCFLTQVVKQHNAVVFWEGMLWPLELLLTSGKRLLEFLLEGSCMLFVFWKIIFKTLIIFVGICRNNLGCSWSCWLLSMNMVLGTYLLKIYTLWVNPLDVNARNQVRYLEN